MNGATKSNLGPKTSIEQAEIEIFGRKFQFGGLLLKSTSIHAMH
jgi:hypothetical protein